MAMTIQQFDHVVGVIQSRRHLPLKEHAARLDGCMAHLEALWEIEHDDSRYPGEWALGPADRDARDLLDRAGITWIASGDVVIDSVTRWSPAADVTTSVNFGLPEFR